MALQVDRTNPSASLYSDRMGILLHPGLKLETPATLGDPGSEHYIAIGGYDDKRVVDRIGSSFSFLRLV